MGHRRYFDNINILCMSNLAWDYNILLTPALLSQGKKYRFLQQIGKIPGMKKLQISKISTTFRKVCILNISVIL